MGMSVNDVAHRHATCQFTQKLRNRHTLTLDAGLTRHDVRIDSDTFVGHLWHLSSFSRQRDARLLLRGTVPLLYQQFISLDLNTVQFAARVLCPASRAFCPRRGGDP